MAAIAAQLRNFKEPSKDQLTQLFFSLPNIEETTSNSKADQDELESMEINAVLSLGIAGEEDSYVSRYS
jgi:hypothetical protein